MTSGPGGNQPAGLAMQIFKLFIDRKWSGVFPTLEFAKAEGEVAANAGHLVHIEPDEGPAFL